MSKQADQSQLIDSWSQRRVQQAPSVTQISQYFLASRPVGSWCLWDDAQRFFQNGSHYKDTEAFSMLEKELYELHKAESP